MVRQTVLNQTSMIGSAVFTQNRHATYRRTGRQMYSSNNQPASYPRMLRRDKIGRRNKDTCGFLMRTFTSQSDRTWPQHLHWMLTCSSDGPVLDLFTGQQIGSRQCLSTLYQRCAVGTSLHSTTQRSNRASSVALWSTITVSSTEGRHHCGLCRSRMAAITSETDVKNLGEVDASELANDWDRDAPNVILEHFDELTSHPPSLPARRVTDTVVDFSACSVVVGRVSSTRSSTWWRGVTVRGRPSTVVDVRREVQVCCMNVRKCPTRLAMTYNWGSWAEHLSRLSCKHCSVS